MYQKKAINSRIYSLKNRNKAFQKADLKLEKTIHVYRLQSEIKV